MLAIWGFTRGWLSLSFFKHFSAFFSVFSIVMRAIRALLAWRSATGVLCLFFALPAHASPEMTALEEFGKAPEYVESTESGGAVSDLQRDALLAIQEDRLDDARKALTALSRTEPRHAGMWMDLAMLYCAAGDAAAADRLFTEIEIRFEPPPPILDVMARQRALGCRRAAPASDLSLRLGRGSDSNVNQGASNANFAFDSGLGRVDLVLLPEYLQQSDRFNEFSAAYLREMSAGGVVGVVQFQSKQYDRLSGYDYGTLSVGAEKPWQWGQWGLRAAGSASVMTLGQQLYLRRNQLQLELAPPLPLPPRWQVRVAGLWSNTAYPRLGGFDAQSWEARVKLAYRNDDLWLQASASAVTDQARGQRPGGDRTGVLAGAQARMSFGDGVLGEIEWQAQRWRGNQNYFPGLIDARRIQNTTIFRAAAVFPLSAEHAAVLEFRTTRNQENISLFDYGARSLQLSWQWQPGKKY